MGNTLNQKISLKTSKKQFRITAVVLLVITFFSFCFASMAHAVLVDNNDGTVTDERGLMWLQVPPSSRMNWADAKDWADNLVFAGYSDWRLPSAIGFDTGLPDTGWSWKNEWGYLYVMEWGNPAPGWDPSTMETMPEYWNRIWWWTETESSTNPLNAYAFGAFWDGQYKIDEEPKDMNYWATAVRGLAAPPMAVPPIALFAVSDRIVREGENVDFDPSESHDPDGTIILYEWDFESDGTFDTSSTTSNVVSHAYSSSNIYDVTLKVHDDQWFFSTVTHQIGVFPASFTEEPAGWQFVFGEVYFWLFIATVFLLGMLAVSAYARAKKSKWPWEI